MFPGVKEKERSGESMWIHGHPAAKKRFGRAHSKRGMLFMCVQCTKRSHEQKLVGGSCAPANEGAKRCEQVRAERPSRRGLSAQCEHEQIDGVIRRGGGGRPTHARHCRRRRGRDQWPGVWVGAKGQGKRSGQSGQGRARARKPPNLGSRVCRVSAFAWW